MTAVQQQRTSQAASGQQRRHGSDGHPDQPFTGVFVLLVQCGISRDGAVGLKAHAHGGLGRRAFGGCGRKQQLDELEQIGVCGAVVTAGRQRRRAGSVGSRQIAGRTAGNGGFHRGVQCKQFSFGGGAAAQNLGTQHRQVVRGVVVQHVVGSQHALRFAAKGQRFLLGTAAVLPAHHTAQTRQHLAFCGRVAGVAADEQRFTQSSLGLRHAFQSNQRIRPPQQRGGQAHLRLGAAKVLDRFIDQPQRGKVVAAAGVDRAESAHGHHLVVALIVAPLAFRQQLDGFYQIAKGRFDVVGVELPPAAGREHAAARQRFVWQLRQHTGQFFDGLSAVVEQKCARHPKAQSKVSLGIGRQNGQARFGML